MKPTIIDIRRSDSLFHALEEETAPKRSPHLVVPDNLTDSALLNLIPELKKNIVLCILDLSKSPAISKESIPALKKLQQINKKLIIIAPQANIDFQEAEFLHPKISIALATLKNYDEKKANNKIYLFKEQLKEFLKEKNEVDWFNNSHKTLKNLVNPNEYNLLARKEQIYLPKYQRVLKDIFTLFAAQLPKSNIILTRTDVKNLSHAFGFDYDLRDHIKKVILFLEIFSGPNRIFFVTGQGVYGCGRLGGGDGKDILTPKEISGIEGKIQQVIYADHYTIFVTDKGAYGYGSNWNGQLGCGNEYHIYTPQKISGIEGKIQQVICGGSYTFIVTDQGVYGYGNNEYGRLGCGEEEYILTPQKISGIEGKIEQVICGKSHSIFVTDQGVYGCGWNFSGQLGFCMEERFILTPQKISGIEGKIEQVIYHKNHTIFMTDQGVYVCGNNFYGQLGFGNEEYIRTPQKISGIKGKIEQVIHYDDYTFFVTDQGVYGCGDNFYGQLGCGNEDYIHTPQKISGIEGKIKQVICGRYRTFIVSDQGVYGCGDNFYGQLGCGDEKDILTPKEISGIEGKIKEVISSENRTFFVTDQGVYVCGDNRHGQLECGNEEYIRIPIKINMDSIFNTENDVKKLHFN